MAHQHSKGRFHPSRVSGTTKFLLALEVNKEKKVKRSLKTVDLSKPDWSRRSK